MKFSHYAKQREVWHFTSYALAGGLPVALLVGGPVAFVVDFALGLIIPLHFHMGMRSVIIDYVHDPPVQRIALALLAAFTVLTALGMTKFNLMDVGITGGIKELFVKQEQPAAPAKLK